jgi:hypothetical protein
LLARAAHISFADVMRSRDMIVSVDTEDLCA